MAGSLPPFVTQNVGRLRKKSAIEAINRKSAGPPRKIMLRNLNLTCGSRSAHEVPVNFSMEPIDIAASLTVEHLQRIETLKVRLQNVEEDRNQFHCPHCDARMVGGGERDYPEYHCIVTYEIYACGMVTEDGNEHVPCPYGPRWPKPEEFDFKSEFHGTFWTCYGLPKTERARTINMIQEFGETREEAESKARDAVLPKKKNTPSQ